MSRAGNEGKWWEGGRKRVGEGLGGKKWGRKGGGERRGVGADGLHDTEVGTKGQDPPKGSQNHNQVPNYKGNNSPRTVIIMRKCLCRDLKLQGFIHLISPNVRRQDPI